MVGPASAKRKSEAAGSQSAAKKVAVDNSSFDALAVNTIRCVAPDLPQAAKSGHPGAPMGCANMAHAIWGYSLNFSPKNPLWINRDRFVLSNGHACALQYLMLHLCGYDLTIEDLKNFRRVQSRTPGHPECKITPGVEVCTGPLGQGISNSVGLAMASHHLAAHFNKPKFPLFDNFIYVICGDGCLQEGISSEACSLAGHLGLGRLIVLYDDNGITIDGSTKLSFTEDVCKRFEAYNWHTQTVTDGNTSYTDILQAIQNAKMCKDKPSLIKIKTTIAYGSVNQGSEKTHGAPLGEEDLAQLKKKFDFDPQKSFDIPNEVLKFYRKRGEEGNAKYKEWQELFSRYKNEYKDLGRELDRRILGNFPVDWEEHLPVYTPDKKAEATRAYSGTVLNALVKIMPEILGGSADLTGSNSSGMKDEKDFQKNAYENRYFRYGVREHGMSAISVGLCAYGCIVPYCATFLNFITYAWGAIRLAALGRFGVLIIATHDSIELGEDGPTHQPIETLALVRATPNIFAVRPADGNETSGAYAIWLKNRETPVVMALCRSAVPNLLNSSARNTYTYGGYILKDFQDKTGKKRKVIIGSSGSELHICVDSSKLLEKENFDVRIVSMPCWDIFDKQDDEYKQNVVHLNDKKTKKICTVYVEASSPFGWSKYFDYDIGMTTFGSSGPRDECWKFFGFTKENICEKVKKFASQM